MPAERVRSEMRPCASVPAPRRLRGDSGSIIAEAAILTPLFVVLLFGILEYGGAFRDYLTLNNATTAGVRQLSISANSVDADYQLIQTLAKQSAALPRSEILHIVVFHATTPTSTPTAACMSGTPSIGTGTTYTDACNVYTSTAFSWGSTSPNWGCGAVAADRYWCPTVRKAAQTGPNGPPDFVGLYMQVDHPYITGLFGNHILLAKTSIIKIEPQSLQ
jgi:Flp pilus assembly protein TadG